MSLFGNNDHSRGFRALIDYVAGADKPSDRREREQFVLNLIRALSGDVSHQEEGSLHNAFDNLQQSFEMILERYVQFERQVEMLAGRDPLTGRSVATDLYSLRDAYSSPSDAIMQSVDVPLESDLELEAG